MMILWGSVDGNLDTMGSIVMFFQKPKRLFLNDTVTEALAVKI